MKHVVVPALIAAGTFEASSREPLAHALSVQPIGTQERFGSDSSAGHAESPSAWNPYMHVRNSYVCGYPDPGDRVHEG